ncbi:MAG: UDP-N-acetylmuramoyl-tripeptide--D-alanyl-D-alanine ligase, partial [Anaerolineae bacterium]
MTQILVIFLLLFWLIRTASNTSLQAYLWQLKEYRLDRLLAHMTTLRGKRLIFNPFAILKWIMLLSLPLLLLSDFYHALFPYAVAIVYGAETVQAAFQILRRRFKRPKFTAKATLLLLASLGVELALMLAYLVRTESLVISPLTFRVDVASLPQLAWVTLLLDKALPLLVLGAVLGLQVVTVLTKRRIIRAAKRKLQGFPHLIVIGITGSYGKTSTKAFLHTILSTRFKTLKTVGSTNTDIGVARTILSDLRSEHEVFVVEMGAYQRGEIKAICDLVKPRIGILTGLNEQHLALFKTLETTIQAKFELIESLPEDGLAVFNGDNTHLEALAQKVQMRKKVYSIFDVRSNDFSRFLAQSHPQPTTEVVTTNTFQTHSQDPATRKADVYAQDIVVHRDRVTFRVVSDGETQDFKVQVLGRQNVPNLLAAMCVAQELGMSLPEIAQAAQAIEPLEQTMRPHPGIHGSLLIDDTYSANPDGVLAALEYLQRVPAHRRIMVTPGMLELGSAAPEAHRRVGRRMAQVCDLAIITSQDYARYLL